MSRSIGVRRRALLESWGEHVAAEPEGPGFDLTASNQTERAQALARQFVRDPSEVRFRELWSMDVIADAVVGGPALVLDRWPDLADLAALLETMAAATEYDEAWESGFPMKTAVWELFGRLHPDSAPILTSEVNRGLGLMGFGSPRSYAEGTELWAAFEAVYTDIVGHATAGTAHEVPLAHEMSEFLTFISTTDEDELVDILSSRGGDYRPLYGWRNEGSIDQEIEFTGLAFHLDGYTEARKRGGFERDGPDDCWNRGYWETWKDAYLVHMEEIKDTYDIRSLDGADVGPFIDDLNERTTLPTPVPAYMLGGRQGGILWSQFRSRTLEAPDEAAEVLSYLFDEEEYVGVRLDRFARFYRSIETSGGPLLSLATILLTFAYPDEYVFYKWSLMRAFFGEFADYEVQTGFDTDQYWKLNSALKKQFLPELRRSVDDATMLDVHTFLYVWTKEYSD